MKMRTACQTDGGALYLAEPRDTEVAAGAAFPCAAGAAALAGHVAGVAGQPGAQRTGLPRRRRSAAAQRRRAQLFRAALVAVLRPEGRTGVLEARAARLRPNAERRRGPGPGTSAPGRTTSMEVCLMMARRASGGAGGSAPHLVHRRQRAAVVVGRLRGI